MDDNKNKKKITDELLVFWEDIIFPYLENRFGKLESDFSTLKNDLRDLKADTPTDREFKDHEKRISKLEGVVFPQ